MKDYSRREALLKGAAAIGAAAIAPILPSGPLGAKSPESPLPRDPFRISLNTSTLRGFKLPLAEVIDIAGKAGYAGIEPWPDEIDRHLESGGTLKDAAKRLEDQGLAVTGAIAFHEWMVDDDSKRTRALEDAKKRLHQIAELRGTHMAAAPAGDVEKVDLLRAAERYRAFLDAAEPWGVVPAMEVWGFAKNAYRLGQCVLIALEAQHPKACVLPDVYHLHKGGSGLSGIRSLDPGLIGGFHLNDYPADPPREKIRDSDRVYPGDGVAPLGQLFRDLKAIGYEGAVSIELFNPVYWKGEPLAVARTALEKTRAVMRAAVG
ncbi:MAG TPA: sugar phosphate isomerase/epimerase family protein [Planctomycetota bacterium]|nr:sugar phosphate isomerase/epimerase family protein [Planctomycetota bacterium]